MVRKTKLVIEHDGGILLIAFIKQCVRWNQEIRHEIRINNIESDKFDYSI